MKSIRRQIIKKKGQKAMILLGKDEIEQLVDRDEMMDEIERVYQIIRS